MQVTIGGIEVDLSSCGVRTLGQLIGAVQDAAAERDEIVIGIELNGEQLDPEQEAAQGERELEADDAVAFTVERAAVLLAGALEQTREGLPELENKLEQVATALQSGSRQEAFSIFSECLTHWRQVVQLLQVSQACLGYDPAQVEVEGRSLQQLNEELLAALQETKQAMEQGNLVALSDLLEYELIAKLRQEATILDRLIGMVSEND
jgi:pantothenate synthetase